MPTYDYRCPNGHDFEHFVRKISDAESERVCPVCGAVALRRVSGGAGLVFKGSGFYLTDYGKNAHRTSGPESGGGDSKSESKGDSKSESSGGGDSKSSSTSDGAKSDGAASTTSAKAESSSGGGSKTESAKSTESKPSSGKTKGGDSK